MQEDICRERWIDALTLTELNPETPLLFSLDVIRAGRAYQRACLGVLSDALRAPWSSLLSSVYDNNHAAANKAIALLLAELQGMPVVIDEPEPGPGEN